MTNRSCIPYIQRLSERLQQTIWPKGINLLGRGQTGHSPPILTGYLIPVADNMIKWDKLYEGFYSPYQFYLIFSGFYFIPCSVSFEFLTDFSWFRWNRPNNNVCSRKGFEIPMNMDRTLVDTNLYFTLLHETIYVFHFYFTVRANKILLAGGYLGFPWVYM